VFVKPANVLKWHGSLATTCLSAGLFEDSSEFERSSRLLSASIIHPRAQAAFRQVYRPWRSPTRGSRMTLALPDGFASDERPAGESLIDL
jgi:hypothetical protein